MAYYRSNRGTGADSPGRVPNASCGHGRGGGGPRLPGASGGDRAPTPGRIAAGDADQPPGPVPRFGCVRATQVLALGLVGLGAVLLRRVLRGNTLLGWLAGRLGWRSSGRDDRHPHSGTVRRRPDEPAPRCDPAPAGVVALGDVWGLGRRRDPPLAYYGWSYVSLWPTIAEVNVLEMTDHDQGNIEAAFRARSKGFRHFLITDFGELARYPELQDHLEAGFQVAAEGGGFVVFDPTLPSSP